MSIAELSRQARLVFEDAPDALSLAELLSIADDIATNPSSIDPEVVSVQLEQELHAIHDEAVDHLSAYHSQVLLALLYHLRSVLTPSTIITFWFDIVLRPALREPTLAISAVSHSKELILSALQSDDDRYREIISSFRTRLLDLYLLDALNEGSEDDILEWAGSDDAQREKKACWKANLEDVLLRLGDTRPDDLITELYLHFNGPSKRLQILLFLNTYTSNPVFSSSAAILANHSLMTSLLSSLLLDNSSTCATVGLSVLVKLLPMFAVNACDKLKSLIPRLFAIYARILCWKERRPSFPDAPDEFQSNEEQQESKGATSFLHIRTDVGWDRLERTFNGTSSSTPSALRYFTFLYYLFPCNLLQFLRAPMQYLLNSNLESPYTVDWFQALDDSEIQRKSEYLLRGHVCHPSLICCDSSTELSHPTFWTEYDVGRITTEAIMLDVRNTSLALRARHRNEIPEYPPSSGEGEVPARTAIGASIDVNIPNVSLQDMVTTSVILRSNLMVKTEHVSSPWSSSIFSPEPTSPPEFNSEHEESVFSHDSCDAAQATQITHALASLQREVLLLRNELNFELWLSRENIQHIGRLFQDRALSQSAEMERQGLYNKLRNYRTQVVRLEKELLEHKKLASSAKNQYADWNMELQKKLREFREEKKSWISEAATLRTAEKEAQALFTAQGKLLADASTELSSLQNQKKENQHKIDRLRDYELQIEQHIKMQRLWDSDFAKFNERGQQIEIMKSRWKQMELRLESFERTQYGMDENARLHQRQVQGLESRLVAAKRENESSRHDPAALVAAFSAEKASLLDSNKQLRETNADLRDEVEELKAMIELLKGQVSGRKGLVSSPRSSPIL